MNKVIMHRKNFLSRRVVISNAATFLVLLAGAALAPYSYGISLIPSFFLAMIAWNKASIYRAGQRGEKSVSKRLRKLLKDQAVVLDNLIVPYPDGRTTQIDHLIIVSDGLYVIETKAYTGRLYGEVDDQYWLQEKVSASSGLSYGVRQVYNPLRQNAGHVRAIEQIISHEGIYIPVYSLVILSSQNVVSTISSDQVRYLHLLSQNDFLDTRKSGGFEVEHITATIRRHSR